MVRALFFVFFFLTVCLCGREPDLTIEIPMRDGVLLPTDIYLPTPDAKRLPIILVRTPSGKRAYYEAYIPLTEAGYGVAIQDSRSFIDKEGRTFPWLSDGWGELQDGYDTVNWIAASPYSNGKVGTMGFSAMGISQLLLSPTGPAPLKAQYIGFAAASIYDHAMFMGGVLKKSQVEGWLGCYAKDPLVLQSILSQGAKGEFWKRLNCLDQCHRVNVPALHYGGWFDTFSQGTLDAFVALHESGGKGARGKQVLIMGPWTHHWPRSMQLGDFEVPENGRYPPFDMGPKAWFDYHLKGERNGIAQLAPVNYYLMGPLDGTPSKGNVWKKASTWPIPARAARWYLGEQFSLSEDPAKGKSHAVYGHTTDDPVPTIGGRNLFIESGPKDQREIEKRGDVLVFTSEPLREDLEVTGRLLAKIFITSDLTDGVISVRLTDVYPDGKSILVADGVRRLSDIPGYRPSGSPCEADVDLWSHAQLFAAGHRLRVSISSANYPQFEDHQEGEGSYRLHFGGVTPSSLTLPVID